MKVLIVKASAFGDILQCYPVIDYLKAQNPDCKIDWVVEKKAVDLVARHPHINRVLTIESKRWRSHPFSSYKEIRKFKSELQEVEYDLCLDLQGNTKSAFITTMARAKDKVGFGSKTVSEWPNLLSTKRQFDPPPNQNRREDYLFLAKSGLKDTACEFETPMGIELSLTEEEEEKIEKYLTYDNSVIVASGSAWASKQLAPKTLAATLLELKKRSPITPLFIYGSTDEKMVADFLCREVGGVVVDPLSLPQLQRLMSRALFVISMDSLPLHLAGTTNTKTYSFFGPSSSRCYRPLGKQHFSYQGQCPYGVHFDKRCPHLRSCKEAPCMKNIKVEDLLDQLFTKVY